MNIRNTIFHIKQNVKAPTHPSSGKMIMTKFKRFSVKAGKRKSSSVKYTPYNQFHRKIEVLIEWKIEALIDWMIKERGTKVGTL